MKRIALAAFGMLATGSVAILSAGPADAARASALRRQAADTGPYASATEQAARVPGSSVHYHANGPAYLPGQTRSPDFQLQH